MYTAILAAELDEDGTDPKIEELFITSVRWILARPTGELTQKLFIGKEADLIKNIHRIAEVAGLDGDEIGYLLGKSPEPEGSISWAGIGCHEEAQTMKPCEIWIEQCDAARQIEAEFGTQNALDYLIGEKFLNFLQAAETDADFRAEIPAFVAGIKTIFEIWQLAEYLETTRQSEPFDPSLDDDEDEGSYPELVEMERRDELRRSAADLLLVEQARGWLLEGVDD
jgi:hypothetical protein